MSKKANTKASSLIGTILAVLVVIIGALVYAVTGVDLLGTTSTTNTTPAATSATVPPASGQYETITFEQGTGARGSFWQVYFTSPVNTRDRSQYRNGVDTAVAQAIDAVQNTLDISAFEMNNEVITAAILRAHQRGVRVRIVTDDEHGVEDDDTTLVDLELEGIPIVNDERSALMHNKFMIMDGVNLWMGSMNYTVNGAYRNNNNVFAVRSRRAAEMYQAEFNEMFERHEFGPRSNPANTGNFTEQGIPLEIYFASENDVISVLLREVASAQRSIRFMTFSFTRDDLGDAIMARATAGVNVQGVFETTGSETRFAEMPRMHCAGLDVRQDGNSGILHHKVFVIDEQTVITGSFNFSNNAVESNDENVMIIRNADIARLYLQEFGRIQSIATRPTDITCS